MDALRERSTLILALCVVLPYTNCNPSIAHNYNIQNGRESRQIIINGKDIDLEKAKIIEDNPEFRVFQPEGMEDVKITKFNTGTVRIESSNGSIVSESGPMTPEQQEKMKKEMEKMEKNIMKTNEEIANRIMNFAPMNFPKFEMPSIPEMPTMPNIFVGK